MDPENIDWLGANILDYLDDAKRSVHIREIKDFMRGKFGSDLSWEKFDWALERLEKEGWIGHDREMYYSKSPSPSSQLSGYKLVAREGEEQYIPKGSIEQDARFFELDSLVRMYGREEVMEWLAGHKRRVGGG